MQLVFQSLCFPEGWFSLVKNKNAPPAKPVAPTADTGITQISSFCAGPQGSSIFQGGRLREHWEISNLLGAACGGLPLSEGSECGEMGVWGKGLPDHLTPCQPPEECFVCEQVSPTFSNWRQALMAKSRHHLSPFLKLVP